LARVGRPVTFVYGQVALAPIIRDLLMLANGCFHTATNFESCEAALTPTFMREIEALQPGIAKALATFGLGLETLAGQGETAVRTRSTGQQSAAAASDLSDLLARLQSASDRQNLLVEVSQTEPGNPRHFTLYLPGTANWSPITGKSVFDLTSNFAAMSGPGVSAPERAALQALAKADFGGQAGDRLTIAGYSEGGLAGANLISSGAITAMGGSLLGLVAVASPISSVSLPAGTKVLAIEHYRDPVPQLDLAERPDSGNWQTVKLAQSDWLGHSLSGYRSSLASMAAELRASLNHKFSALFSAGQATLIQFEASRS